MAGSPPIECQAAAQAAAVLGWHLKTLNEDGTLPGVQNAFTEALQLHPAGLIEEDGQPLSALPQQIAAYKAAKIPIVWGATPLPGQSATSGGTLPFPIIGGQGGTFVETRQAEAIAVFVATDSKCDAHVGLDAVESIPVFKYFDGLFTSILQGYCPNATTTVINSPLSDIGAAMNNRVVSALESHPNVNYVEANAGLLVGGLAAAIKSAGLPHAVKIVGTNPQTTNYSAIANGTETAWPGLDAAWYGWYAIDSFARYFSGSPLVTEAQAPDPVFMLDKATYRTKGPQGQALDVANGLDPQVMMSQFKADWLAG
jgi:ribose transport system substrate-binding protein